MFLLTTRDKTTKKNLTMFMTLNKNNQKVDRRSTINKIYI